MISKLPHGRLVAGAILVGSGTLLVLSPDLARLFSAPTLLMTVALSIPLLAVQLLQGGARPFLGWLAIALIFAPMLALGLRPLPRGFDPFTATSAALIFLALYVLPIPVGFVLLGVSMNRTGYFPRLWGYLVALVPLSILVGSLVPLGVLLIAFGLHEIPWRPVRWGSLLLAVATIVTSLFLERRYQMAAEEGWTTYFPTDRAVCDLSAAYITADIQDRIWIVGRGECDFFDAAHVFDGASWIELEIAGQYSDSYEIDSQGQLWRLRQNKGEGGRVLSLEIAVFHDGVWSTYVRVDREILDDRFGNGQGLVIDKLGQIWIPFQRLPAQDEPTSWTTGVSVFNGQTWITYTSDNTPSLAVERMAGPRFDDRNRGWFWSEQGTLSVFDGATWEDYPPDHLNLAEADRILRLELDGQGNPWLGTAQGLIVSGDGSRIIDWQQGANIDYPAYQSSTYFDFGFDLDGRLWVAGWVEDEARLSVYDGTTWSTFTHENSGLTREGITDLEIDAQGNIWLVTPSGIRVFSPDWGELAPPQR